ANEQGNLLTLVKHFSSPAYFIICRNKLGIGIADSSKNASMFMWGLLLGFFLLHIVGDDHRSDSSLGLRYSKCAVNHLSGLTRMRNHLHIGGSNILMQGSQIHFLLVIAP